MGEVMHVPYCLDTVLFGFVAFKVKVFSLNGLDYLLMCTIRPLLIYFDGVSYCIILLSF